jgi:hypothetical protein
MEYAELYLFRENLGLLRTRNLLYVRKLINIGKLEGKESHEAFGV